MNTRRSVILCFLSLVTATYSENISLVGATVINPGDGKVLPNATVVINGNKIERVSMGKQDAATLGKQVSCVGKFILPGYIDTHVHFFQSADLFTRPDGADFNSVRAYKDEVAWIKSHLDDVFARYMCRIEELRQSIGIVKQALEGMPTGPVKAAAPKVICWSAPMASARVCAA